MSLSTGDDKRLRPPGRLRTRTRQVVAAIGTTALGFDTLGNCWPVAGGQRRFTKTVTITLGYAGGTNIDPYYNHVIQSAENALPGIKVQQVVYATYDDQLNEMPTQVAAGTIPDIIVWDNSAPVGQYAQQGAITSLNKLVKSARRQLERGSGRLVNAWTINGNLYGIPLYLQDSAYVYNLGMLKAAGYHRPAQVDATGRRRRLNRLQEDRQGRAHDPRQPLPPDAVRPGLRRRVGLRQDDQLECEHRRPAVPGQPVQPARSGLARPGRGLMGRRGCWRQSGRHVGRGPWYIGFMSSSAPNVNYALGPDTKFEWQAVRRHLWRRLHHHRPLQKPGRRHGTDQVLD